MTAHGTADPTGQDLKERAALESRLLAAAGNGTSGRGFPRRAVGSPAPSTAFQRGLYLLHRLEPAGRSYRMAITVRLRGRPSRAALSRAVERLVDRHEALRTVLRPDGCGGCVQHVLPETGFTLRVSAPRPPAPAGWTDAAVVALATQAAHAEFDLEQGPLFRADLFELAEDDHLMVLAMHHAIADAWSVGVIWEDFAGFYHAERAAAAGLPGTGGDAPAQGLESPQYTDYAAWLNEFADSAAGHAALADRAHRLGQAPAALSLPLDHPRPARREHRGGRLVGELDRSAANALDGASQDQRLTQAALALAALAVLLHRWSGDTELVIGVPVARRDRAWMLRVVGPCAETVPVLINVEPDTSLRVVAERCAAALLEAISGPCVPFDRLVGALNTRPTPGRNPVYQALFAMQSVPTPRLELDGLEVRSVDVPADGAKLDLALHVTPTADGYRTSFEFDHALFLPQTIQALADQYAALVRQLAVPGAMETAAADLPLHDAAAAWAVVDRWSETPGSPAVADDFESLSDTVGAWARKTPAAPAIVTGHQVIDYQTLHNRLSGIADSLVRAGARPGVLVAVLMDREPDLICALLAVDRAGAAYLPLDPTWPTERIRLILDRSTPGLLVTDRAASDRHAALVRELAASGCAVVDTSQTPDASEMAPAQGIDVTGSRTPAAPGDLAYVIYTSGSTGTPKGVMITRRALRAHAAWAAEWFEAAAGAHAGSLLQSSVGYDLPVPNIYAPLSEGLPLVLADPAAPAALAGAAEFARGGFGFVKLTPTHLRTLTGGVESGRLPSVARCLVLAGEELHGADLGEWSTAAAQQRLVNEYGPTETTVAACVHDTTVSAAAALAAVPIGRPVPGARVYLLDRAGRPVPPGVIGEIHIGGRWVASGYHKSPALTAERFVPDPFSPDPGGRMYRTGDLARYRADGELVFLGRSDLQVKIRGVRVEVAEVERVLRAFPGVAEAAVRVERGPDTRLHGFVVLEPGATTARLDGYLRSRLPAQMVPGATSVLDRLPITGNGKLDRNALARLAVAAAPATESAPSGRAPATPAERALIEACAKVLDTGPAALDADFFAAGGNSLSALNLIGEIEAAHGVRIPLAAVFDSPRLCDLAAVLDTLIAERVAGMSEDELADYLTEGTHGSPADS